MPKMKTLAQLPYPSKEWDDEMERQQPGWAVVHGVSAALVDGRTMSEARRKRLLGYPTPPGYRDDNQQYGSMPTTSASNG